MKEPVIAENKVQLEYIIELETHNYGKDCDLNHIDTSRVTDMSFLFYESDFNGDISKWDTGSVTTMEKMFYKSQFNGDISKWNVSNVIDMRYMFERSLFNGDIGSWDVKKVQTMEGMFYKSKFDRDISKWQVSDVIDMFGMFKDSAFTGDLNQWTPYNAEIQVMLSGYSKENPYWGNYVDIDQRKTVIDRYISQKELHKKLEQLNHKTKDAKKIKL